MEISYLGHSCFKIVGKKLTVIMDPFDPEKVGIKLGKYETDVVTVSHEHSDHNFTRAIKNEFLLLDSPGEFEVKEVEFTGVSASHGNFGDEERGKITVFTIEIEGIKVCHLGDLGSDLNSEQLEEIDGVDILLIPVGGVYTIDSKAAAKIVSQIEPKIVIPMHYKIGKMQELAPLEEFIKEIGIEAVTQEKIKVTVRDLPEKLELVILKTLN
jgi:L-ascorbate metabolism protein UlaG (beta-lactamase superfamily)